MQKHTLIGLVTVGMLQAGLAYSAGGEPGDDSVHAWGRWEQMIAPAAGPEVAITPVAIVAPEGNLDLRPEEGQAFGRQVIVTNNAGDGGPNTGLPDVSDALPDTPIGTTPPTPAPPTPPGLPGSPLGDVTDNTSGAPIGTVQPNPAPPPPAGLPAGPGPA